MSDKPPKDTWDKLAALSRFLAAVFAPLILGLAGHWYTDAIGDRETSLKEREFIREWVQLSLEVLRDETAMRAPPWFARFIGFPSMPGTNAASLSDAPNMRALRVLPDPARSQFFACLDLAAAGATTPTRHDFPARQFIPTHSENTSDQGVSVSHFNTWIAVLRRDVPASLQDHSSWVG